MPILNLNSSLKEDEKIIYQILKENGPLSISKIIPLVPYSRSKAKELIKKMVKNNIIQVTGKGRGTKYFL